MLYLIGLLALCLPLEQSVTVSVVAAKTRQPIADAAVSVVTYRGDERSESQHYSDAEGRLTLSISTADLKRLNLSVRAAGFAHTRLYHWNKRKPGPLQLPDTITVRMPRAVSIGGTVVSPDGQPVPNLDLRLEVRSHAHMWPPGASAVYEELTMQTDVEGRWVWADAPDPIERYRPRLQYGNGKRWQPFDFDLATLADELRAKTPRLVYHNLKLPDPIKVTGIVVDPEGAPVASAVILSNYRSNDKHAVTQTDSDGRFALEGLVAPPHLDPNNAGVRLYAHADGFATSVFSVGSERSVRIELGLGQTVAGRVVDPKGAPVVGAGVKIAHASAPQRAVANRVTDEFGDFEVKQLPAGPLRVEVTANHYRPYAEDLDPANPTLVLSPLFRVRGVVRDAGSGQPIQGVTARSHRAGMIEITKEDGRYDVPFAGRRGSLTFEARGYRTHQTADLTITGDTEHNIDLLPQAGVAVRVMQPDGQSAAGARVLAFPGSHRRTTMLNGVPTPGQWSLPAQPMEAVCDTNGQATLHLDAEPEYVIVLHETGVSISDPSDFQQDEVVLALQELVPVTGQVGSAWRRVADRVRLTQEVRPPNGSSIEWVWEQPLSADGAFSIAYALPNHRYTLHVGDVVQPRRVIVKRRPEDARHVVLTATGRPVVGKLDLSGGMLPGPMGPYSESSVVLRPLVPLPDEIRLQGRKAIGRWQREQSFRPRETYRLGLDPTTATYRFENIPSGSYLLEAYHGRGNVATEVTVPGSNARAVEVPTLNLRPRLPFNLGKQSPTLVATHVDGTQFDARRQLGKLTVFYLYDATDPNHQYWLNVLQTLHRELSDDPLVDLFAINTAGQAEVNPQHAWPQLILDLTRSDPFYAQQARPSMLVVQQDGHPSLVGLARARGTVRSAAGSLNELFWVRPKRVGNYRSDFLKP